MNPPYQRGDVWGVKRRRNLIKSILMGIPIPSIIVNDRCVAEFSGDDDRYAVIDGKQRIITILMFLDSELAIPSEWVVDDCRPKEKGLVVFSDMRLSFRRGFESLAIACSEVNLKTIEEEKEVFDLVNFGGLAQGERDHNPF